MCPDPADAQEMQPSEVPGYLPRSEDAQEDKEDDAVHTPESPFPFAAKCHKLRE